MNDTQVSLNSEQRDILLRGLRYVRSAVALDVCDFTPEVDAERRRWYSEIEQLESLIGGEARRQPALSR